MSDENTRDDAERLEMERQTRLRVGSDAQRRIRDADQAMRDHWLPNDIISVRDAALRKACAELDALDAALRDARAELVNALKHNIAKDDVAAAALKLIRNPAFPRTAKELILDCDALIEALANHDIALREEGEG